MAIVLSPDDREMANVVQVLGLRVISSESTNLCDEISRIPTPSRDLKQLTSRGRTLLTSREQAVLFGIRAGLPLKEIAHNLRISPNTVSTFKARIMLKLGVTSTIELWRITPAREQGRQAQARELDPNDNVPEV
ncbi:MAG: response regulator transcription factor [Candidatus Limnocylindrus sp.]